MDNYFTGLIGGAAITLWVLAALFLVVTVWEQGAINPALGFATVAVLATGLRVRFWWADRG